MKLSALEKEHEALKIENEKLKTKIIELEEQAKQSNLREDPVDLDLSFGPRYCKICGHESEDGYQLDAHIWSEHEDDNV